MSKSRLTVQDNIVLFLYENDMVDYDTPYISADLSQDGISGNVGVSRPHIQIELKRLESRGYIKKWKARIEGQKRKRWMYALSDQGIQYCETRLRRYSEIEGIFLDYCYYRSGYGVVGGQINRDMHRLGSGSGRSYGIVVGR